MLLSRHQSLIPARQAKRLPLSPEALRNGYAFRVYNLHDPDEDDDEELNDPDFESMFEDDDDDEGDDDDARVMDIALYSNVGESFWGDGLSSNTVQRTLKAAGELDRIHLRINSMGGDVHEGIAIYNLLSGHPAKVVTVVDGLAASSASLIAMAGDKIYMRTGSQMMVHNPMSMVVGDSDALRQEAKVLDKIGESIVAIYAERTGRDSGELEKMVRKATWMTAQEAVDEKFADAVRGRKVAATRVNRRHAVFNCVYLDVARFGPTPKYESGPQTVRFKVTNSAGAIPAQLVATTGNSSVSSTTLTLTSTPNHDMAAKATTDNAGGDPDANGRVALRNASELRREFPDIYNEVFEAGKNRALEETEKNRPPAVQNAGDLKKVYPQLHQEIFEAGQKAGADAEFGRIADIESYDDPDCPEVQEIIRTAKADRTKGGRDIAKEVNAAVKKHYQKQNHAAGRRADAQQVNQVKGGDAPQDPSNEDEKTQWHNFVAEKVGGAAVAMRGIAAGGRVNINPPVPVISDRSVGRANGAKPNN